MKSLFPFYSIGHFINEPSNSTDFEIIHFEDMQEPNVDDVHKHTFYEITWIEKGKSRQTIDYKEYEVLPNSLFFISPGQVHSFEEWKPLVGGSILFTGDFFLLNNYSKDKLFEIGFLDNFYANPCIRLNKKDFAEIKKTIDGITNEQRRKDRNSTITQALLHILLAQVQRCTDGGNSNTTPKKYLIVYKQLQELLDIHFSAAHPVSFYAGKLHITRHHLNLVVKTVTGITAGEVIRARSMLEAKRLLTFSDAPISEIAAQLNYFDSSYFAKLFKQDTGQTPIAFRNKMSDKYRLK
ncbi:MAG TPA: AraC family transcriptional regulator [Puia sp.]|nr:AraC family transcriptional regulator [Puia sp.]